MSAKILLVDDDKNVLTACERLLRRKFTVETAEGGEVALAKISVTGPYAVVVADRQMPGMDGAELLCKIRDKYPDTVRIMLTGNADMEAVIRLVNETNIFRFLTKPCPGDLLTKALEDGLRLYQLTIAEKELFNKTLSGSIKVLTDILSMVGSITPGQTPEARQAIAATVERLGLNNAWEIQLAIMLAPIGTVTVPAETLVKSRTGQDLTKEEKQMLEQMPVTAANLLAKIPRLEGVAQMVRYQHKNFDGSGFPSDDISGDNIPIGARLLKIILDHMEMRSTGASLEIAFETMANTDGLYDPVLLGVLRQCFEGKAGAKLRGKGLSISVSAKELAKGMVLRSSVETKQGALILAAGHQINDVTLEKIRNFESVVGVKEPILVERIDFLAMEPA